MNSVVYGWMLINDIRLIRKVRRLSLQRIKQARLSIFPLAKGVASTIIRQVIPQTPEGKDMRRQAQTGFTLVELVVVIVILGILAAVALPRFVGLQTEARYAKLQAVAGAIKGASAMAHSAFIVAQAATSTTVSSISMEGASNVALTNGYPSLAGIATAANLGEIDGVTVATATSVTVTVNGAAATCKVTYDPAASTTAPPTITLPTSAAAAC